jgi:Trk K+ transport system NAD-binding subunit
VAIGNDLEASILTTALLAEAGIRDIWAKAVSRQQATILERVGAHHVVFPEQDMGERIAHLVVVRLLDWVELDPQWVFAKTKPPKELVGVPLGESGLRKRHRVTVVSHRAHLRQPDRHRRQARRRRAVRGPAVTAVLGAMNTPLLRGRGRTAGDRSARSSWS